MKQGGGDVGEAAVITETKGIAHASDFAPLAFHQNHRYRIGGVGGPGLTVRTLHQLCIAMVGGDQQGAPHPSNGIKQPADAMVNGLDRFGGS